MQILELVLYSKNGQKRVINFNTGKVNIITGKSKSGKSAVGDIIDYCLGSSGCNIADGVIRECVSWYGLLLQIDNSKVFVARKNPSPDRQTTNASFYLAGKDIKSPDKVAANCTREDIVEKLSRLIGIEENQSITQAGQTRSPFNANIRHALLYCFQNQNEIATRSYLFHKQAESHTTPDLKATMPYFLGATDTRALQLEAERKEKTRELKRLKRLIEENESIRGDGLQRGQSLLREAIAAGLIENVDESPQDFNTLHDLLEKIPMTEIEMPPSYQAQITELQDKLETIINEISDIELDIDDAKKYQGYYAGYGKELYTQKKRLESIGLYDHLEVDTTKCPFCSAPMEHPLPGINAIRGAIEELEISLSNLSKETPRVQGYINQKKETAELLKIQRKEIEAEINALFESDKTLRDIRSLNTRRAHVLGRISLWLESSFAVNDNSEYELKISSLERRLTELENLLDSENTMDRVHAALSNMQTDMTAWAKELELGDAGYPYRIDYGKMTIVTDKERTVPLDQMGSGSNWVGAHLIALFALHKYFAAHERPVPGFLYLDQPSQVYFPSMEAKEENKDLQAVSRVYDFIASQAAAMNDKLQVIIVDHAQISDEKFQNSVIESWWEDNENLIPLEWTQEKNVVHKSDNIELTIEEWEAALKRINEKRPKVKTVIMRPTYRKGGNQRPLPRYSAARARAARKKLRDLEKGSKNKGPVVVNNTILKRKLKKNNSEG